MDGELALVTDAAVEQGMRWLARAGLRPTRQRVSLASLLIGDGFNRHVTAESLYKISRDASEN